MLVTNVMDLSVTSVRAIMSAKNANFLGRLLQKTETLASLAHRVSANSVPQMEFAQNAMILLLFHPKQEPFVSNVMALSVITVIPITCAVNV